MMRSPECQELLLDGPAFILLTCIALRAKRRIGYNKLGLELGEAMIGDYENIGLSRQNYRTAKQHLEDGHFATFKPTTKGTIAKLCDSRVFDINTDCCQPTSQPTANQQDGHFATNKPTTKGTIAKLCDSRVCDINTDCCQPTSQPTANQQPTTNEEDKNAGESTRARELPEYPDIGQVQAHAAIIGLAPWKAEDWFNEMEACGWLDHLKRPVHSWQAMLARIKTRWEADGRPSGPPTKTGPNGHLVAHRIHLEKCIEIKEQELEKLKGTTSESWQRDRWPDDWKRRPILEAEIKALKAQYLQS